MSIATLFSKILVFLALLIPPDSTIVSVSYFTNFRSSIALATIIRNILPRDCNFCVREANWFVVDVAVLGLVADDPTDFREKGDGLWMGLELGLVGVTLFRECGNHHGCDSVHITHVSR